MALKDAVATVLNRNAFYRDGYRLLLRVSLIQMGVIVLLILSLIGLVMTVQTRQVYFATTSDGRIIPIMPLSERFRSDADVVTWAANTAQDIMRFDYADYRARLQQIQNNNSFTSNGWDNYNKALAESKFLDTIVSRKLVVSLQIDGAPEIRDSRLVNGVWTWDVRFPVTIKFDGVQPPQPMMVILKLRIMRVSTLQNPDGISIDQWVQADPASGK